MKFNRKTTLRIGVVLALYALPVLVFAGFGLYYLYQLGWSFYGWIGFFSCTISAYILTMLWTRKGSKALLPEAAYDEPLPYWTDRDRSAWTVVEAFTKDAKAPAMGDFEDPAHAARYATEFQELALKVAHVYKPGATDPFQHLTIAEILTAGELVAHDLHKIVDKYLPGSDILTIQHFKRAKQAMQVYQQGQSLYWLVSAIFNPLKTAVQLTANQLGLQSAFSQIQNNVMQWFYLTYLHEVGRYLIELNSGRLKVGPKRYLELMAQHQVPPVMTEEQVRAATSSADAAQSASDNGVSAKAEAMIDRVTVAVVGPVSAGKSSLINAFFGEHRADVAQTPMTARATRYELNQVGLPPLTLIDTVGFGVDGATDADVRTAVDAMTAADIALLVVPAKSAARAPELDFLDRMRATFAQQPQLRLPPVLCVLSQIDLLTPAMEWKPPYNWRSGSGTKEQSIREAVKAAKEVFTTRLLDVVPVCTAQNRVLGVREELIPEMAKNMASARGVSLLRALHITDAIQQTKKVVGQVWDAGKQLFKAAWQGGAKK